MTASNINRHAFLIMAHNEFHVLRTLVKLLDNERNDIYIHFDKKVSDIPKIECTYSHLYILQQRIDTRWGTSSQVETEFLIFGEAVQHGPYMYYHLLSGVDLPIKTMKYIHDFFDNQQNLKEFVEVTEDSKRYEFRIQQYHFGVDKIRSRNKIIALGAKIFGKISPMFQKHILRIIRNHDIKIVYGSNWVSITDAFAKYLLSKKEEMLHRCTHSKCADEIFLQTVLWNSPFRNNLYLSPEGKTCNMREIEWDWTARITGGPHTFQDEDFPKLINSRMLFARKFSYKYPSIIKKIESYISCSL